MAVFFINTVNSPIRVDGSMVHHGGTRGIRVGIRHDTKDGYLLSRDNQVIKEELTLDELIRRIHVGEHGYGTSVRSKADLETDTRQVLLGLSDGTHYKIEALAKWLDARYMNVIRSGRVVLPDHTYSRERMGRIEQRETVSNRERSVTRSEWNREKFLEDMDRQGLAVNPMTINEAYRVDDKEIYYLLT